MPTVEVTVKDQRGKCAFGHKVGDKIVFDGRSIKGEICYSALLVLLPEVYAMLYGATFPWAKEGNIVYTACPDPDNPVTFEVRRVKE